MIMYLEVIVKKKRKQKKEVRVLQSFSLERD